MADEESARPMDRKCPPCELRHRSALYLEKDGFTERLICIKCHLRASINREIDSGGIPKMIQIRQVFTNHIKQISDWVQSLVDRNIRITEEERIAIVASVTDHPRLFSHYHASIKNEAQSSNADMDAEANERARDESLVIPTETDTGSPISVHVAIGCVRSKGQKGCICILCERRTAVRGKYAHTTRDASLSQDAVVQILRKHAENGLVEKWVSKRYADNQQDVREVRVAEVKALINADIEEFVASRFTAASGRRSSAPQNAGTGRSAWTGFEVPSPTMNSDQPPPARTSEAHVPQRDDFIPPIMSDSEDQTFDPHAPQKSLISTRASRRRSKPSTPRALKPNRSDATTFKCKKCNQSRPLNFEISQGVHGTPSPRCVICRTKRRLLEDEASMVGQRKAHIHKRMLERAKARIDDWRTAAARSTVYDVVSEKVHEDVKRELENFIHGRFPNIAASLGLDGIDGEPVNDSAIAVSDQGTAQVGVSPGTIDTPTALPADAMMTDPVASEATQPPSRPQTAQEVAPNSVSTADENTRAALQVWLERARRFTEALEHADRILPVEVLAEMMPRFDLVRLRNTDNLVEMVQKRISRFQDEQKEREEWELMQE